MKTAHPIILFIAAYILGLIASIMWFNFGEEWQIFGDAVHYVSLYNGEIAPAPWGYRVLTPYLASFFPWDIKTNFTVVAINSVSLTAGVIALYGRKVSCSLQGIFIMIFFWVISYPFVYYSTAIIRVDAPMLLMLATLFLLSKYRVHPIILLLLISLGIFSHEMILVFVPALWLDKIFSGKLTGGANYKYYELFFISLGSLFFLIFIRNIFINVSSTVELSIFNTAILEYTGGFLKHGLRVYAAYGPVLLFCLFFISIYKSWSVTTPFIVLLFLVILVTFHATDTLRVMAILYLPILLYATKYLLACWKDKRHNVVIFLIFLQALYSLTVYAHLRTFETSIVLNIIAASISLISLILCIVVFTKNYVNN